MRTIAIELPTDARYELKQETIQKGNKFEKRLTLVIVSPGTSPLNLQINEPRG